MTDTTGDMTSPSLAALESQADSAFDSAFSSEVVKAAPVSEASEGSTPSDPAKTEAVSETATASGSTPPAEATPVVPSTPEQSEEWKNLLAKYGGDQNAAAKSYWETVKTTAQLAREKEELAAKLAAYEAQGSTPKAPEPQQAVKDIPNELRRYDENIRVVETNFATTQQERGKYAAYLPTLDQEIRTLNRTIANPPLTADRDELVMKLNEKLNEREAVTNYISQLDRDLKGFDKEWQDLKDRRAIREQVFEQAKELETAREAKARSEEERDVLAFKQSWDGTIDKVAKDTSVIPAVLAPKFDKYVRALGKAYVADGSPITDVEKFVRDAAIEYMSGAKEFHQVQSAEYAKLKKDDAKTTAPNGDAALASETKRPRADWTQKQWDDYHENFQL